MAASKKFSDSVPPLPASLKSISSFVQRADELRTKDPVMAYWLTYYAAQLGLDLKSHEAGARDYLFALITYLEEMKKELEGNDAVENEAAGAAYVENFALKVFALADNEDRRGEASRSTAKKFLAAANFLELLKVFEKSNNAEVNEEKVRYAKWKASDIAKAFREGRKPTPGAAGNGTDEIPDNLSRFNSTVAETPTARTPADRSPVGASPPVLSSDAKSPNIPKRTPPSTSVQLPDPIYVPPTEVSSSGTWSTVATPGSEAVGPSATATRLAFASAMNRWRDNNNNDAAAMVFTPGRSAIPDDPSQGTAVADATTKKVHFTPSVVGDLSSTNGSPPPSPELRKAAPTNAMSFAKYVSAAQSRVGMGTGSSFSGRPDPTMAPLPDSSPSGSSRTSLDGSPLFNSNNVPGRLRSGSSPPRNSVPKPGSSPPGAVGAKRNSPPRSRRLSLQSSAPPAPTLPTYSGGHGRRSSISGRPSPGSSNPQLYPSYPPPLSPNSSSFASTSAFASPSPYGVEGSSGPLDRAPLTGLPPVASNQATPSSYLPQYAPKPPSPPSRHPVPTFEPPAPVELTPALIAKAQKHCRYAISALEYEDPEQARKELRAALALLGER